VSQESFHRDYLLSRMDNAPSIHVPTNGKYPFLTSPVPPGVNMEREMPDNITILKFMDHDITDERKFLELAKEIYFFTRSIPRIRAILLETQNWVTILEKADILNLLEIPHFEHNLEINACVKVLLNYVHGGALWLDPLMSIDTALFSWITWLPKVGEDPTLLFNKEGDRALS
jgi:hypothetical protein